MRRGPPSPGPAGRRAGPRAPRRRSLRRRQRQAGHQGTTRVSGLEPQACSRPDARYHTVPPSGVSRGHPVGVPMRRGGEGAWGGWAQPLLARPETRNVSMSAAAQHSLWVSPARAAAFFHEVAAATPGKQWRCGNVHCRPCAVACRADRWCRGARYREPAAHAASRPGTHRVLARLPGRQRDDPIIIVCSQVRRPSSSAARQWVSDAVYSSARCTAPGSRQGPAVPLAR
jgi:hypothetical protein